jgi:hypothetical protein
MLFGVFLAKYARFTLATTDSVTHIRLTPVIDRLNEAVAIN